MQLQSAGATVAGSAVLLMEMKYLFGRELGKLKTNVNPLVCLWNFPAQ
jgi:hypothetical protein